MTAVVEGLGLRVVDGRRLAKPYRDALNPGGVLCDTHGRARLLPRFFYEVPSWEGALTMRLAPHFALWEFVQTDVREAPALRTFPRYVPCAVTMLAAALELFRDAVGTFVHITANGGYRSPAHAHTRNASTHCWATAVNIYKIGDTYLDDRASIERYAAIAREAMPGVWARPYGTSTGLADDHLHLDFGYVNAVPRDAPSDVYNPKLGFDPL
jgi:hypothetical protein